MNQKHAFPCLGDNGMTLRDYFAGQAMQEILSHFGEGDFGDLEQVAEDAYRLADCMLAAREKPPC